ncbi:MAG: hypothetical protein JXB62_11885 [Pirellulales bacterium]|nr:hypothetical protein [Pirellulales bacterium]
MVAEESLAGEWATAARRRGSTLTFTQPAKQKDRRCRVAFKTHWCMGGQKEQRTAESRDGMVLLDRPVAEILGPVYQRLCCVRVGDLRRLAYLYEDGP